MTLLFAVGRWYAAHLSARKSKPTIAVREGGPSRARVAIAIGVLLVLIFSKYFYLASLSSYYTFYLIERFGVSVTASQGALFVFLGSVAAGTFAGGPIGVLRKE